jgi:hypothetical protein
MVVSIHALYGTPSIACGTGTNFDIHVSSSSSQASKESDFATLSSLNKKALPVPRAKKPMSWLWHIRPHGRDEAWSASLWQTFFAMTMGAQIPVIAETPLAACGCRKFQLDPLGDHLCTCTAHWGAKKAYDWAVTKLLNFPAQHTERKRNT